MRCITFVLFCIGLVFYPPRANGTPDRTKVAIGYSAMQASVAPFWIAQERGLFTKYGIDPQLIFVRTTSVHTAGLISGQMEVSYGGGSGVISTAGSGSDLRFIASFASRLTHVLVTRPDIQSPKDLRRKRLGVVSIGGTQWITTKLGLEYLGVDEQRDEIRVLASVK